MWKNGWALGWLVIFTYCILTGHEFWVITWYWVTYYWCRFLFLRTSSFFTFLIRKNFLVLCFSWIFSVVDESELDKVDVKTSGNSYVYIYFPLNFEKSIWLSCPYLYLGNMIGDCEGPYVVFLLKLLLAIRAVHILFP